MRDGRGADSSGGVGRGSITALSPAAPQGDEDGVECPLSVPRLFHNHTQRNSFASHLLLFDLSVCLALLLTLTVLLLSRTSSVDLYILCKSLF